MLLTPAANTFENRQIALSLAYLTYCGDQITTANPDKEIRDLIWTGMQQIPVLCTDIFITPPVPNWFPSWGPVAYTTPGALYQDSLMYLVQNKLNPSQYVVAIRGTNHVSDLDWLMDDFDVLQQMPWPPGSTIQNATGMISESTSIALQVLLNMSDGSQTLLQYLNSVTSSAIDLWVTGHSLGGCLASAFGLYLTENVGTWDQSGASTVSCATFAAPTAGNGDFASLVENAFSNTVFDRVQCSYDIVPLAWVAANIVTIASNSEDSNTSNIFDIYDQGGSETGIDFSEMEWPEDDVWNDEVLDSVLPTLQNYFTQLGYTQPFATAALLPGTFNTAYTAYDQNFETTAEAFGNQASYQHSSSYPALLDVPQLNDPNVINQTGSESGSAGQAARPGPRLLRSLIVSAFNGLKEARLKAAQTGTGGGGSPIQSKQRA